MRFLLDENVDFPLVAFLQRQGHDVTAIAHDYSFALKDTEVLQIAVRELRILITNDHDFGELIVRQHLPHNGIILLRLHNESLEMKQRRLLYVLTNHSQDMRDFVVVTDEKVRVRRTGK